RLGDLRVILTWRAPADAALPAPPPVAEEKEDRCGDENGRTRRNQDTEHHRHCEALDSGAAPDGHRQETQQGRQGRVDAPRQHLVDAEVYELIEWRFPMDAQVLPH